MLDSARKQPQFSDRKNRGEIRCVLLSSLLLPCCHPPQSRPLPKPPTGLSSPRRSPRPTMRISSSCRTGSRCRPSPPRSATSRKAPNIWRSSRSTPASSRRSRADRRRSGRVRDARRRREATLGMYFMYDVKQFDPAEWSRRRSKGGWSTSRVGKAVVGRGAVNQKGPEARVSRRAPCVQGGGPQAAGEPRAGRGGRGGDRLAAFPPDRRQRPKCSRRCKKAIGVFIPCAWQDTTAPSRSTSAPRA